MRTFFVNLYAYFYKHKIFLFSVLLILIAVLAFFAVQLKFDENILSILPKNKENERISYVFQNINSADKIIIKITNTDSSDSSPDELIENAESFISLVDNKLDTSHMKELFYKTDDAQFLDVLEFMFQNIPYFLTEEDYERLDTLITSENIATILEENKKMLTSPIGMMYRKSLLQDPLRLSTSFLKELNNFRINSQYTTYEGYIFSQDLKSLLIFLTPRYPSSDTYNNSLLINELDNIIATFNSSATEKNQEETAYYVSYFGAAAIAVTNASQIKKDSILSIIIASTLIILILSFYFRNIRSLIVLLLPIIFGALFAFAGLYLTKGTISTIAIGTGSIIFGIAINYSLHFVIHLRQQPSIAYTIRDVAFPLTVGSITTIAAFSSLIFLRSKLLGDFGLFAALTLAGTILFTLIFLPHFFKDTVYALKSHARSTIWNKIADYSFENNKYLVLIIIILTVLFSFFSNQVKFEEDMNKINFMTKEQRATLNELSQTTTLSQQLIYVANEGDDIESALQEYEKNKLTIDSLQEKGVIKSCQSVGPFFPSKKLQQEKLKRWNNFLELHKDELVRLLKSEGKKIGFTENSFSSFENLLNTEFEVEESDYFTTLKQTFLNEFLIEKPEKSIVLTQLYLSPTDANSVKNAFPSSNSYAFDTKTLTQNMLNELSFDFNYLLWICGLIVLLFLFISFGRVEITVITFLPMAIAFIWILGLMGIFNIHFNIVNIILATFIFGIGDDYAIFIMEGLIYEYSYGKKMLNTYKTAVVLSAITMLIGIGSLIFAKHPAMFSLAQVSIIGMISVAIIAYTIAPFIFKWLISKKGKARKMPLTLLILSKTVAAFTVFSIGAILLSIFGFFVLTLGGKTEKHKLIYHQAICKTFRFLCRVMPQIPCEVQNPFQENFANPGIIICNHQSHLDLLYTLMLSPKIICLTNKTVWNSPFYGWVLRYASYYPINRGIENNIPVLQQAILDGYSILVFPEGTRSPNCEIQRFHQGAFHLAQKLNVDIIPIITHGIGHITPKTELILRKGKVTVKILERIRPDNQQYRKDKENYKVAKLFRQLYKEEYKKLTLEKETADYYRDLVLHNYFYKGVIVERHARRILSKDSVWMKKIEQLPDEGTHYVTDCEYGVYTLLAALVKKNLTIIASDPDPEKLALARHCPSVPANLIYVNQ